MIYIPITNPLRKECEETSIASFTEMNEACKKGDESCKYILKVATYHHNEGIPLRKYFTTWYNEVTVLYKLNSYQSKLGIEFSPYLYDWWYVHKGSEVHFYLLLERFHGDLVSLVGDGEEDDLAYIIAMETMACYLSIIHHDCKLCLNDIKLKDMLFKEVDVGHYRFVFSNFSSSTRAIHREDTMAESEKFYDIAL